MIFKTDEPRISPVLESGKAFHIRPSSRLECTDMLPLKKPSTVLFCALKRGTRRERFQLAGTLAGKSRNILLPATQNSAVSSPRTPAL